MYLPRAPAHSNDIDKHNDTNYAHLHGVLKAYKDELAGYTETEEHPEEAEEDGRIILKPIGIPFQDGTSPEGCNDETVMGGGVDYIRMKNLGWVRYNPFLHKLTRVDYKENSQRHMCGWVRYNINLPNPQVQGCNGPNMPIYSHNLHTNPCNAPNFTEPWFFQDDALQIFHPTHTSHALVDRTVTDLHDPELEAEILRFRYHMGQCDCLSRQQEELAQEELLILTSRYLAHSRGTSRIGSTILTYLPPEFPIAVNNRA